MEKEYSVIGGRYLLKKKIGQGGRGSVYLCHDNKLHKNWAAKELLEPADAERSMELELLKSISCTAFPRIVDIVKEEGIFYLIMDFIEGVSLKDKMKQQLLTEADVLPWAIDIAKGILHLHKMTPAILYMDCKPDNIMLTWGGEIRLVDLGSAYVCWKDKKQRISGTKYFAPREQRDCENRVPDVRSDIYAFGMTLYYLLTGGKKEWRINGRLYIRDVNPHVSWGMSHIIEKCTMDIPEHRFQSMEDVIYQLHHIHEVGRWKKGKELFVRIISLIGKSIAAFICLVFAYQYETSRNILFFGGFILFLSILLTFCMKKRIAMYEIKRDIFCGNGKRILYIFVVVVGLMSVVHITSYAARQGKDNEKINKEVENSELKVVLYDKQGRKILIKDGTSWGLEEDVIIRIPIDEISEGEGKVVISYANDKVGEKKYSFMCYRKNGEVLVSEKIEGISGHIGN